MTWPAGAAHGADPKYIDWANRADTFELVKVSLGLPGGPPNETAFAPHQWQKYAAQYILAQRLKTPKPYLVAAGVAVAAVALVRYVRR